MGELENGGYTTIVRVRDLQILAFIGVNHSEVDTAQPLTVSFSLTMAPGPIETLGATADYRIITQIAEALAKQHIPLIETFGQRLAEQCLALAGVRHVVVTIDKPFALPRGLAGVEVSVGNLTRCSDVSH